MWIYVEEIISIVALQWSSGNKVDCNSGRLYSLPKVAAGSVQL